MNLGVLGTMVWDRIEHPDGETVERWGGIAYSLAAAAAAVPDRWTIRPIVRLGHDLAVEGRAFLDAVPGLERPGGVVAVDEPNNRVRLRYRDRHHREEHLTGGVSGWSWPELEPHLSGLDGLYVNLISGFELDHETTETLAERFDGPRYIDIHSLVMGVAEDGRRMPRSPDRPEVWLGSFHVIQANENELAVLADRAASGDVARHAVRDGARAVLVTRGPRGARWFATGDGPLWPAPGVQADAETGAARETVRSGDVTVAEPRAAGDPTGCGDVWGATCFAALVEGAHLSDAMDAANRAAARNVDHRGADGLYERLRTDPWT